MFCPLLFEEVLRVGRVGEDILSYTRNHFFLPFFQAWKENVFLTHLETTYGTEKSGCGFSVQLPIWTGIIDKICQQCMQMDTRIRDGRHERFSRFIYRHKVGDIRDKDILGLVCKTMCTSSIDTFLIIATTMRRNCVTIEPAYLIMIINECDSNPSWYQSVYTELRQTLVYWALHLCSDEVMELLIPVLDRFPVITRSFCKSTEFSEKYRARLPMITLV
jgi:hypothetical protein